MKLCATVACGCALSMLASARRRAAECYNSIEDPYHFKNKTTEDKVFPNRYQPYQLGEIIPITHDTALFRFLLPKVEDPFNLKPCSTLQACYKYGVQPTEQCQRFYTPVTPNKTQGFFDIVVKRKDGLMTNHLFGMHVGDKLLFRSVAFKLQYRPNKWKHIGMIAGGTGFTPMLQLIRHSLDHGDGHDGNARDTTKLSFLYCNRTERHILFKGLLDDYQRRFPRRFRLFYTIDHAVEKESWPHWTGYVTAGMVKASMPPPSEDNFIIMLCGPDQLLNHVAGTPLGVMKTMSSGLNVQPLAPDLNNLVTLGGILGDLGYSNENVYRF